MQFRRKPHGISRTQAHAQKLAQQAPPPPPRSRRKALARLALRLFIYGLLIAVVALLVLFYTPLSFDWLDRRIEKSFQAATGLGLATDQSTIRISEGTIQIDRPRLLDPNGGRTLANADRILIDIPPNQFLHRPPYAIRSVTVETSLTLPVTLREKEVTLGPDWDRVRALAVAHAREARARRKNRRTSSTLQLHDLVINTASIRVVRERGGQAQRLLQLDDARLLAEFAGGPAPRRIGITGRLNDGPARDLTLELRPDLSRGVADCMLGLDGFDSLKDIPWSLPTAFSAGRIDLLARVGRQDDAHWTLSGNSVFRNFDLASPDTMPGENLGDARAEFKLSLDRDAARLNVLGASLDSKVLDFRTSGTLVLRDPWPYDFNVDPLNAQGRMFAVIASALGRGREVTRPGDATFDLHASMNGNLSHPLPDDVNGRLVLSGLSLRSPDLPPMDNMRLTATMTTHTLNIEEASAIVQGMPMAFTGMIRGRPLRREVLSADVTWKANGDLVSVSTLIQGGTRAPLELSGKVSGAGRVFVPEPLAGSLASVMERTRVEGQIDLTGVSIRHPGLLEPILNLNGHFDFIENTARLTRGSAEWMGFNVALKGQLKGKPLVWNQPRLTLTGAADFDIANSRARLAEASPAMREMMRACPEIKGLADLDLILDAELERPAEADYTATLNVKDLVTSFSTPHAGGPLSLDEVSLSLTPRRLRIGKTEGKWGEMGLKLAGEITPSSATLHLLGSGPLNDLGQRIPILGKNFRLGGSADYDGTFLVRARKGFTPPESWRGWMDDVRGQPRPVNWREWAAARFVMDGGGDLFAHEIEWTYYAMPARIWGVSGPMRFDMRRLWTPKPLPVRGGERSLGNRGMIELIYGSTLTDMLQGKPRQETQFNFNVLGGHMAVEEWLKPWHFRKTSGGGGGAPQAPLPYNPKAPVKFRMRGDFKTSSASFRGVQVADFSTELRLDVTPREYSNLFTWRNISGHIGQGDFMIEGEQVSHEVQTNVIVNAVELEPLIKGLTGKEHVSGIFSGKLSGKMVLKQSPGANRPLTGSGTLHIVESRFVSNNIFNSLGGLLRLPIFENISFSTIEGPFEFEGERYTTKGITFDNPTLVHINVVGAYGPASALDMELQLQFLPKALGRIPLVGEGLEIFNRLVGKVLRFKLRGTPDAPIISPI